MSLDIAVIILTLNEDRHIERAIRSVQPFASEIIVIDSYSIDGTVDIARSLNAQVYQRKFINHADQFQWALDNVPLNSNWVFRLDADEYPTSELIDEIVTRLPKLPADVGGIILNRRHIFMGRFIGHGGRYPLPLLRIWRKGAARVEQRWMDEHIVLLRGQAVTFEHDFCDHNLSSVSSFVQKHNGYATREAIEVLNQRYGLLPYDPGLMVESQQGAASTKRLMKERFYNRLPYGVGPAFYFLYRYFVQLGFLDGKEGLAYHFLQGFWYRMLVSIKVLEFDKEIRELQSKKEMVRRLGELSGLSLVSANITNDEV